MKLALTRRARGDLLSIREGKHGDGVSTGDPMAPLIEAIEELCRMPERGQSREAVLPGLRTITCCGHVVFYCIGIDAIIVGLVLEERRAGAALRFAERLDGA
ncbi:MAG: type II toxin-antitoxin system RelE/ParE family toxin [Jannaschia sp.]